MAEPCVKIWNVLFIANLRWKCRIGIGRIANSVVMAIEGLGGIPGSGLCQERSRPAHCQDMTPACNFNFPMSSI